MKNARCPVIISCSDIPLALTKYAAHLQFLHVVPSSRAAEQILDLELTAIFRMERSGIVAELAKFVKEKKPADIAEVVKTWGVLLRSALEKTQDEPDVKAWISDENFNVERLFLRLYNAIHGFVSVGVHDEKQQDATIEMAALRLECRSSEGVAAEHMRRRSEIYYTKPAEASDGTAKQERTANRAGFVARAFFHSLPIQRLYRAEMPLAVDLLHVRCHESHTRVEQNFGRKEETADEATVCQQRPERANVQRHGDAADKRDARTAAGVHPRVPAGGGLRHGGVRRELGVAVCQARPFARDCRKCVPLAGKINSMLRATLIRRGLFKNMNGGSQLRECDIYLMGDRMREIIYCREENIIKTMNAGGYRRIKD